VNGGSSLQNSKTLTIDTTNPTVSVTTPVSDGLAYNAATLPANLGGTSADAGGSGVSTVQIAIQDGAGNYWGGATFNQAAIFYNATGGTTANWTYATATLLGQLTTNHTYTITAKATDAATNVITATRTFIYDTTAPTVSSVTSTQANGSYKAGTVIPVTVNFSEPVTVTGSPTLALNTAPAQNATYASGSGTSALVFNYTVIAGRHPGNRTRLRQHRLARPRRRHDQRPRHQRGHPHPPGRQRRQLAAEQQDAQDRHHHTDRQQRECIDRERLLQRRPDDRDHGRLQRARQRHPAPRS